MFIAYTLIENNTQSTWEVTYKILRVVNFILLIYFNKKRLLRKENSQKNKFKWKNIKI